MIFFFFFFYIQLLLENNGIIMQNLTGYLSTIALFLQFQYVQYIT